VSTIQFVEGLNRAKSKSRKTLSLFSMGKHFKTTLRFCYSSPSRFVIHWWFLPGSIFTTLNWNIVSHLFLPSDWHIHSTCLVLKPVDLDWTTAAAFISLQLKMTDDGIAHAPQTCEATTGSYDSTSLYQRCGSRGTECSRISFLNWFWDFWNWLSNMIKDASNRREHWWSDSRDMQNSYITYS
jgi:hypothetical protein